MIIYWQNNTGGMAPVQVYNFPKSGILQSTWITYPLAPSIVWDEYLVRQVGVVQTLIGIVDISLTIQRSEAVTQSLKGLVSITESIERAEALTFELSNEEALT